MKINLATHDSRYVNTAEVKDKTLCLCKCSEYLCKWMQHGQKKNQLFVIIHIQTHGANIFSSTHPWEAVSTFTALGLRTSGIRTYNPPTSS